MFPDAFPGPLGVSLIGSAWREHARWRLECVDIRAHSPDKRGFLDDTPAGGGAGQVMRADVIASALDGVERGGRPLLYMSAPGSPPVPGAGSRMVRRPRPGGPLRTVRGGGPAGARRPRVRGGRRGRRGARRRRGGGVRGDRGLRPPRPRRLGERGEHGRGELRGRLLEHPQYTRPRTFEGLDIPEVLLGGNHGAVARWRRAQREDVTRERRPDLWSAHPANQQPKGAQARRKDADR